MQETMRDRKLTAVIERDGGHYVALCPELDVASQGGTADEARCNLVEALTLLLDVADASEILRRLEGADVTIEPLNLAVG